MLSTMIFLAEKNMFIVILTVMFLLLRRVFRGRLSFQSLRLFWVAFACSCIMPICIPISIPVMPQKTFFAHQSLIKSPYMRAALSLRAFYRTWVFWVIALWLLGVLVLCIILLTERVRLNRIVGRGEKMMDGTIEVSDLPVACSFGIIKTSILIPKNINAESKEIIRRHEYIHAKRRDPLLLAVFTLLRAVYWFNPALWLVLEAVKNDIEYCCDQEATSGLSDEDRRAYAECLIAESTKAYSNGNRLYFSGRALINRIRFIVQPKYVKHHKFACASICVAIIALSLFQWDIKPEYNNGTTENVWVMGIDKNGAGSFSIKFETGEYRGYYFIDSKWYSVKGSINNPKLLKAYKELDYNKLAEKFLLVDFINVTSGIAFPVDDAEGLFIETFENM